MFPAEEVRLVPFWVRGGDLCPSCWVEMEIDKHTKRIAVADKVSKPKKWKRRSKK